MNVRRFKWVFLALSFGCVSIATAATPVVSKKDVTDDLIDEPGRGSYISAGFDRNPHALNSYSLSTDVSVSQKIGILGDYKIDQLSSDSTSDWAKELGIGAAFDFSDSFSGFAKFESLSLPGVKAGGGSLGIKWFVGDWTFGGTFEGKNYSSDGTVRARRLQADGVSEKSGKLSAAYRFNKRWSARVAGTGYGYGGATPSELAALLATRPAVSAGLISTVEGFPTKSGTIGATFYASEQWDIDLSFSRTTYELYPISSATTLSVGYQITPQWQVGMAGTSLKQDDDRSGEILAWNATFSWD